ncbi:MAG: MFS transporter [Acidimicrobiia bacterium]|nr:MFS transporter [Acidimicrobiia bacterium]
MRRPARLHYAWIVFVTAFVTLLGAAGFRSTPGILIDPLREEFGWSRATVGTAVSINVALFGFIGPFAAALQARYGLRRVTVIALITISLGALGTTQMDATWQLFLLWGVVVGIGSGCMATVFASTVASRWFVARRGLVTGALTAATASGQLVFLPVLSRLAEGVGWRWVGFTIACGALGVVPLVVLFLRDRPEDIGLRPYGAPADHPPTTSGVGTRPIHAAFSAFGAAYHSGTFWLLFGSFFVCGLSTNGLIQTHFVSAAHDHGLSASTAAGYLALIGVFDVIGTIGSGYLTDRVDPRKLLVVYYLLRGLSLLVIDPALAAGGGGLLGFMVFYGLDWVATVPPTVALCLDEFGTTRGPLVYGWVFAGHQLGAALAAWGAGELRDVTGTYRPAFVAAGICCMVAAVGVTRIRQRDAAPPPPIPTPTPTPILTP